MADTKTIFTDLKEHAENMRRTVIGYFNGNEDFENLRDLIDDVIQELADLEEAFNHNEDFDEDY